MLSRLVHIHLTKKMQALCSEAGAVSDVEGISHNMAVHMGCHVIR